MKYCPLCEKYYRNIDIRHLGSMKHIRSLLHYKEAIKQYDEILKQDDFTKTLKQLKDTGAVKTAERATLEKKYPGIDQNLLTKIIEDKDPQRKAEVLATLDEAMIMGNKGMSTEKIIETLMSTPRKKQAEGGLSYLMGM